MTDIGSAVHTALCDHLNIDDGRGSRKAVAGHLGIHPVQYSRYVTEGGPAAMAHLVRWARERGITVHLGPDRVWCTREVTVG